MAKKTKEPIDIKSKMLKEKDDILKQLLDKVDKIVALLKKQDPYKTLSDVIMYFKFLSFNIFTEYNASKENVEAKFALEFIQMLLSTIEKKEFQNECLEQSEFFEIINYSTDIFSLKTRYLMALQFENKKDLPNEYIDYIFLIF